MDHFWLTDEQFARIAPLLPNDTRARERVDDRRVISGIVHVLKSGGRWTDAPRDLYGLSTGTEVSAIVGIENSLIGWRVVVR